VIHRADKLRAPEAARSIDSSSRSEQEERVARCPAVVLMVVRLTGVEELTRTQRWYIGGALGRAQGGSRTAGWT